MMTEAGEIEFVCPTCSQTIAVNDSMRTALIEHGCVICGAEVTAADFSE